LCQSCYVNLVRGRRSRTSCQGLLVGRAQRGTATQAAAVWTACAQPPQRAGLPSGSSHVLRCFHRGCTRFAGSMQDAMSATTCPAGQPAPGACINPGDPCQQAAECCQGALQWGPMEGQAVGGGCPSVRASAWGEQQGQPLASSAAEQLKQLRRRRGCSGQRLVHTTRLPTSLPPLPYTLQPWVASSVSPRPLASPRCVHSVLPCPLPVFFRAWVWARAWAAAGQAGFAAAEASPPRHCDMLPQCFCDLSTSAELGPPSSHTHQVCIGAAVATFAPVEMPGMPGGRKMR